MPNVSSLGRRTLMFTGKHREQCECSRVCALNKQACCGYTQHTGVDNACMWKAMPLVSFSHKWKMLPLVILSLISGGSQISLHKSHKQWQKAQISYHYFFICAPSCLHLFWPPSHRTVCMITRLNTRHTGKVYNMLEVRTKKVPLSGWGWNGSIMFIFLGRVLFQNVSFALKGEAKFSYMWSTVRKVKALP